MHRNSKKLFWLAALVVAIGTAAVGLNAWLPDYVSQLAYASEAGKAQAAREQLAENGDLSQAFKTVAKVLRPSVVSVHSVIRMERPQRPQTPQLPEGFPPFFNDELFERFFDGQQGFNPEQRGLGSGVVISEDGLIVTNNHVVRGATSLNVTLSDGRTLDATLIGSDAKTDLALLRVEANGLVPAVFGDSDSVEVGEWVMAIGNPFELQHTVTAGIVSAKSRAGVGLTDYEDFIQTDAAINPGNSGGPLVNLKGEVIGINTAIASRNGGYMGVGFAIPSNMVRMVTDAISRDGRVTRGQLGALIQDLNEELAQSFEYSSTDGVLVGDVMEGSAAAKAGVQPGDIITQYNGRKLTSANQLRNAVAATAPGTDVTLEIFRDGKRQTLQARLGELSDEPLRSARTSTPSEATDELGMTVQPMTSELAEQLGYESDQQGVVVTNVEPGSLAARLGLQRGDVILAIGEQQIRNLSDYRAALQEENLEQGVRVHVMREGVRRFLFLKVG